MHVRGMKNDVIKMFYLSIPCFYNYLLFHRVLKKKKNRNDHQIERSHNLSATTFRTTTLGISTLSIMAIIITTLSITILSIKNVTTIITETAPNFFILSVKMLSGVLLFIGRLSLCLMSLHQNP
jgi:hypothetical protein